MFGAAFATQALSTLAQYALLLAVPIVLDSRGWSAASIGLSLSFLTLGMVVMGPYGGRLGDTLGRRRPSSSAWRSPSSPWWRPPSAATTSRRRCWSSRCCCSASGLGVATPSVMTAGIEAAPPARVGSAAGLLSASRYVGSIASTLVLAGVVADDGDGLSTLLVVSAASLAVSLVAARQLPGRVEAPVLAPS